VTSHFGATFVETTNDFYCEFVLSGRIAVDVVAETLDVLAFHHTRPSYPLHIVIVPKAHIVSLVDVDDLSLIQSIFAIAKSIVVDRDLQETNFRIVTNGGSFQDSKHLHFHLISGDRLPSNS
jgi:histidine triad (HIT) family protein